MGMDEAGVCPYMEREDARCVRYLTLQQIGEAFDRCVCHYEACGIFRQIRTEQRAPSVSETLACVA